MSNYPKSILVTILFIASVAFVLEVLNRLPSSGSGAVGSTSARPAHSFESEAPMDIGRWLSNIPDPYMILAEQSHTYTFEAIQGGYGTMHEEWNQYMKWVQSNIIGPPKATEKYTQNEMGAMGIVGLYSPGSPGQYFTDEHETIMAAAARNDCDGANLLVLFAIRKAENGPPGLEFGVICQAGTDLDTQAGWAAATIVKNRRRWTDAGCPSEFIDFLGNRYCPAETDPIGNKNWKRNVKFWVARMEQK